MSFILFRLRLWLLPLQFLLIYAAYFRRFLDPTLLLFTFVMLPEPQTLPLTFHWRRVFGFLTGIILILILPFTPHLNLDPLLLSLLIANFVGFLLTKFTLRGILKKEGGEKYVSDVWVHAMCQVWERNKKWRLQWLQQKV